mgnify:CR=1 FL=1
MEEISFQCSPEEARNSEFISAKLKQEFVGEKDQKIYFLLKKRSIDSRKRAIKINLNFLVSLDEFSESVNFDFDFKNVAKSEIVFQYCSAGSNPSSIILWSQILGYLT